MEGTGAGLRRLQALCDKLERLSTEQARQLLYSFQECAAAVWRGSEAFATELRAAEVELGDITPHPQTHPVTFMIIATLQSKLTKKENIGQVQ